MDFAGDFDLALSVDFVEALADFGAAAAAAGVGRIIYLGGLGDETRDLSPHLRSRHEVGRILRACGVPTLEFRASIAVRGREIMRAAFQLTNIRSTLLTAGS